MPRYFIVDKSDGLALYLQVLQMGGQVATGTVVFATTGVAPGVEIEDELADLPARQGPLALGDDPAKNLAGDRILDRNEESAIWLRSLGQSRAMPQQKKRKQSHHVPRRPVDRAAPSDRIPWACNHAFLLLSRLAAGF